ncbi:MAG: glycosyltransferase family 4 protein [Prolixibacteraceae bacterium]
MKILALSQAFWPDTASISQHLADLTIELNNKGHEVSVLTSRNDYENPKIKYQTKENYNGIEIQRLRNSSLGKKNKISRLIDFISFNILVFFKLLFNRNKYDMIISLTQPPLLAYFGIIIAKIKKIKFVYWTMDLQPELSIIAGYVKKNSFTANSLQRRGDYIFKKADIIITLDKYMKNHIIERSNTKAKIDIVPVWPVMSNIYEGLRNENPFRNENNFGNKIVIMYSGNHSVMHPLDTLLDAAYELRNDSRFIFVHIGGGIRLQDVKKYRAKHSLDNIKLLPYQPREKIHLSLGSADLQVVILGDDCVGYTHPNKIYGAMYIGKPLLYIGPSKSHISDILDQCPGNISINHGQKNKLVNELVAFADKKQIEWDEIGQRNLSYAKEYLSPKLLLSHMINSIEGKN